MYNLQLKSPLQLFVNGKFICNIETAEIVYNSKEFKKELTTSNGGTVINVTKSQPLSPEEKAKQEEEGKDKDYDEFFKRMTGFPEVHEKIDW
jgi:hypothetical protein